MIRLTSRRQRILWTLMLVGMITGTACTTSGPTSGGVPGAGPARSTTTSAQPKSIVAALSSEPLSLGPFQVGGQSHQGPIYQVLHDFLVVHTDQGEGIPHVATARPSQSDGTWKVFPDGKMETTWTLRKGVKWSDGTELTSQDIIFGWKIANDSEVPWSRPAIARLIDTMEAPDDYTIVMHWRRLFPFADNPEETTLDPLPVHILQPAYDSDVQAFVNSPYWTREFIGLGPYRLVSWEPGSSMSLRARDDYYGGRAKIDSITVRFVADPNALVANLLSGAVDVQLPPSNLNNQHWQVLEAQWGDGTLLYNQDGTFGLVGPNHRVAPFGEIPIRQALAYAIDREAVADALFLPRSAIADAMVTPGSDKEQRLRDRITVYNYDPARAQALLAENGWTRGSDGIVRNTQGLPFEFEYKSGRPTEATVIADQWKSVGLQPQIVLPSPALMADLEYQATVKGVESTGFGLGFGMWERRIHSSAIPTPETRWAGTNRRYCSNPEMDSMIDRFVSTLDEHERENIEGDMIRQISRDAVLIPLYVASPASSIRKGITGIKPMKGNPVIVANYYNTWNILEWDRS